MATITRTKRTGSKNSGNVSDLARAASERGRDAGGVIANQVVDRIVNNSTQEFQDYLARVGNGTATNNAAAMVDMQSQQPVPFGAPEQMAAPIQPPPFGDLSNLTQLMGGGMPAMGGDPYIQPVPFASPPPLMPSVVPSAMPSVLPAMPSLSPTRPAPPIDPNMERTLRAFGLI